MKFKIKIIVVFSLFAFYWLSTIFFTIPENYLQIKSLKYKNIFSSVFYQQWSFFAPPPRHNERLYYEFVNSHQKDTLTVEVLRLINDKRREQFLSNDELSIIDYILSNTISGTTDIIRENFNDYKYKNCKNVNEEECFVEFIKYFNDSMHKLSEIKTLKNYGIQILKRDHNTNNYDKFKIISTNVAINKFSNRYDRPKNKEVFIFNTKYYNLKNNLWEE